MFPHLSPWLRWDTYSSWHHSPLLWLHTHEAVSRDCEFSWHSGWGNGGCLGGKWKLSRHWRGRSSILSQLTGINWHSDIRISLLWVCEPVSLRPVNSENAQDPVPGTAEFLDRILWWILKKKRSLHGSLWEDQPTCLDSTSLHHCYPFST